MSTHSYDTAPPLNSTRHVFIFKTMTKLKEEISPFPHKLFSDLSSIKHLVILPFPPCATTSSPPTPPLPPNYSTVPYCSFCARRQKICLPDTQGCLPVSHKVQTAWDSTALPAPSTANLCVPLCVCTVNNTCACVFVKESLRGLVS